MNNDVPGPGQPDDSSAPDARPLQAPVEGDGKQEAAQEPALDTNGSPRETDVDANEPAIEPESETAQEAAPVMVTGRGRTKRLMRAGIFALLGMVILLVGIFVIGNKQNLFSETISIYTTFQSVEGLKSGASVMMSGIKIGTVSNVQLMLDTATYVRVDMVLEGDYHEYLRRSTYATIAQSGLIGDKLIELRINNATAPLLSDGDSIGSVPPPNYTAILDEARGSVRIAEKITASLDTLFMRFRRGEGTLGKLLTDEAAYNSIVRMTVSAEQLMDRTNQQIAAVGGSVDRAAGNVLEMTAAGRDLMLDVSKGKGTIGALMYDRTLYDSLESLTGALSAAASSAGFAAREFGLNMRGLRSNWLVGGLFGGDNEQENVDLLEKQLRIREEELRRQRDLLEQREKKILDKERTDEEVSKK
jgi:phospholipid/cholesterol/gamma-HCH transport system substrate-binding protein